VIRDLLAGEYSRPVRIICFNPAEGWCRDVTMEVADEVRRRSPRFWMPTGAESSKIAGLLLSAT